MQSVVYANCHLHCKLRLTLKYVFFRNVLIFRPKTMVIIFINNSNAKETNH